jgi:FixJ family two-component response regulator
VITDQTMPHLTGLDMAREMIRLRPACPIILCSGLSEQINEVQVKAQGIAEFMKKPIKKHVLAEIVHRVLNSVQGTEAPKE